MVMKQRGSLVGAKKRTNRTNAVACVETIIFISKNSWFQPGLWNRSQKFLDGEAEALNSSSHSTDIFV